MSTKPLPLKQRTSSVNPQRDYTAQTWKSLIGLVKLREFFITVDHFSIWKRHLAWAIENGKDLRDYMTQRYSSSMVFMSLLLSTELSMLFNSSTVICEVREALRNEEHTRLHFWAGFFIIISAILTVLGLISTFTAWTMVSAVSEKNAHCVFRSSIGQYVAELPGKFIVGSIYTFMIWLVLFFFILLPVGFWSTFLMLFALTLFVHTIAAFSAFGRIIMHSGAMGTNPIFESNFEAGLEPHSLHNHILSKARANLLQGTSIRRQYGSMGKIDCSQFSSEHMPDYFSDSHHGLNSSVGSDEETPPPPRKRAGSLVRFSDEPGTNKEHFSVSSTTTPNAQINLNSPLLQVVSEEQNHTPLLANTTHKYVKQREPSMPAAVSQALTTPPLQRSAPPSNEEVLAFAWLRSSSYQDSPQTPSSHKDGSEQSPRPTCQQNDSPEKQLKSSRHIRSHNQNHPASPLNQPHQHWSPSIRDQLQKTVVMSAAEDNVLSATGKCRVEYGNRLDPSTPNRAIEQLAENWVTVGSLADAESSQLPQGVPYGYNAVDMVRCDDNDCDSENQSLLPRMDPGTYHSISRPAPVIGRAAELTSG